jgi:hypothetical protein
VVAMAEAMGVKGSVKLTTVDYLCG